MDKYCCFFCPKKEYSEKSLEDLCPTCGRPYGFVLDYHPIRVDKYTITKHLGRGFYGAAFVAESGFGRKFVLKISPIQFYSFFDKPDFMEEEVALHVKVAESASHVVGILDAFQSRVEFSDDQRTSLDCNVTVLDFVDGDLLKDYISGKIQTSAAAICQIAVDLLRIRAEFEANELNHNDLHDGNLIVERLRPELRRADALYDSIRVKAIDLGSISDESKSTNQRLGDLHFIAKHVDALLDRLLINPSFCDDRDFRIALSLQSVVHGLQSSGQNIRLPNFDDFIRPIQDAYNRAAHPWRPWNDPFSLRGFGDHYNAQTLESWDVPRLLVDPDDRWMSKITMPGPQIITGMRGCGKTMLLRALDIHARATQREGESSAQILDRIRNDNYIGLFVSAQRLLDLRQQSLYKLEYRLSRLFINYAVQAARALLHLKDLDPSSMKIGAHTKLASAVADFLEGANDLRNVTSIEDLEQRLTSILVLTIRDANKYSVKAAPMEVFSHLAEQLCGCYEIFRSSTVFFLLDDVSTRYMELDKIDELLSSLLFQSPHCAFKFTSEWQTIELGLKSPGREHPVREGRDITVFDLGADVFETINSPGNKGKDFVSKILLHRAQLHVSHPRFKPKDLLGDVSLEQVAREIASSNETSDQKKRVYRGLSCLTNVCVGDIGDVIKLYEEIIRRAPSNIQEPISGEIQSSCFRDLGSRRLYDLNRRKGYFKGHALAFAEAAHDLLVRSYRNAKKEGKDNPRLRQYSSIYVRVTSDDENSRKEQIDRLRDLIDASVFVFSGGAPRTKTKDSNPTQQFILSYRKIYGLAAFIGLADRDRFELSGADLEEWLTKPNSAKDILLRNQIKEELEARRQDIEELDSNLTEEDVDESNLLIETDIQNETTNKSYLFTQGNLFEYAKDDNDNSTLNILRAKKIEVEIKAIDGEALSQIPISAVITGLGFEDRTLASNQFLSNYVKSKEIHAIRYSVKGHAEAILEAWQNSNCSVSEIPYSTSNIVLPSFEGLAVVDISGLTKPLIFHAIQREMKSKGRVIVCHAAAEYYYPLQEDLEKLFAFEKAQEPAAFIESLAKVLMGEKGPYDDIKLLDDHSDPSRTRALLAFASPKHERLFTLLDRREFDYIEVIAPKQETPRAKVATYAADFICQNYANAKISNIDTDDLLGLVKYLDEQYLDLYSYAGANLELGMTGSKTQAVAAAILSARRKMSQVWYLSPKEFDVKRFSTGVGPIRIFDINFTNKK